VRVSQSFQSLKVRVKRVKRVILKNRLESFSKKFFVFEKQNKNIFQFPFNLKSTLMVSCPHV